MASFRRPVSNGSPLVRFVQRLSGNRLSETQANFVLYGVILVCVVLIALTWFESDESTDSLESEPISGTGISGP